MEKITPFLWFDSQAEEAAKFYTSIFPNSKITGTTHYTKESAAASKLEAGSVMTVEFELNGQKFVALNGGPVFKFTPATSWVISCETQEEIDHYWSNFLNGGKEQACGWIDDKFGVTWQVVPKILGELLSQGGEAASRVTQAFLKMTKFDLAAIERAAAGE